MKSCERANTTIAAAHACTPSLTRTGKLRWSSQHPIAAIISPAAPHATRMRTSTLPWAQSRTKTASKKTAIAAPPPLGVGTECELLAFGTSRTPRRRDHHRKAPVNTAVATAAVRKNTTSLTISMPQERRGGAGDLLGEGKDWLPPKQFAGF